MSFSYNPGPAPNMITCVRALIADTDQSNYIFEDEEIQTVAFVVSTAAFQSGQWFNTYSLGGSMGVAMLPASPAPLLRIAAQLLDSLAANYARLANNLSILDIKVNTALAAQELRNQATQLRETDDNSGAFMIAEQVLNPFSFRQRFWSTWQRQAAGN